MRGWTRGTSGAFVAGMRLIRAVFAVLLLATPAFADDFDKELDAMFAQGGLTAEQAASRAMKTSPNVRAGAARVEASEANEEAASLARIPRVAGTASYTRLSHIDSISLGPGASLDFLDNSYLLQGQVQLPLSDYLLRFPKQIAAARLATEAARLGQRQNAVDAAQEARLAYYEWVRARLQTLVAKRQLTQVQATLGQVRALADAQRVSRADLMRVESQEAQTDQIADQLQQLSDLREEQLRILIGAGNEQLAIGEDIRVDVTAPGASGLDELVTSAQKQRLDFRSYDVGIEAREKQRSAEKSAYYPSLSAFGTADYARPNQRVFPQVDEFRFTWQAGVQLTWNINEPLITRAQDKRLRAEIQEMRVNRENLVRGTRIAVMSAQQAVSIAQHALATSKKGLDAANESYRVRQALLAAQRATAVELVDAETELTRARIAALDARIDLRIAMVQLAHAIGTDTK
jgi:outer membrane protein TolC